MPRQNNPILPEVKHKENTRVIVTKLIANAKKMQRPTTEGMVQKALHA